MVLRTAFVLSLPGLLLVSLLLVSGGASAHPLAPALLEIRELGDGRAEVRWRTSLVAVRGAHRAPVLPAECQFPAEPAVRRDAQGVTVSWRVDCGPGGWSGRTVAVEGLESSGADAVLRVRLADGRAFDRLLRADAPGFRIPFPGAAPPAGSIGLSYLRLGAQHILTGPDHLLFVLGLLLLVRGARALLATVTAFTLGHSATLSLAVLGLVNVPPRPIELAIAASVFFLAVELARPQRGRLGRRPWLLAALFGLLHGLGFAGALAQVGLPPEEIPLALFSFNAGIELGQVAFVAAVLGVRAGLVAFPVEIPAWGRRVPVYAMGSLAAFWCLERAAEWGL
ncbi:MAG: HupE/UreJ family protein [Proteobacteria bacterium]|nr:HupE/UreJ family protein [Pseudomonadota bacterium]